MGPGALQDRYCSWNTIATAYSSVRRATHRHGSIYIVKQNMASLDYNLIKVYEEFNHTCRCKCRCVDLEMQLARSRSTGEELIEFAREGLRTQVRLPGSPSSHSQGMDILFIPNLIVSKIWKYSDNCNRQIVNNLLANLSRGSRGHILKVPVPFTNPRRGRSNSGDHFVLS